MKFHTFVSLVRKMLIFMSGFSRLSDLKNISKLRIGWKLGLAAFSLISVNGLI